MVLAFIDTDVQMMHVSPVVALLSAYYAVDFLFQRYWYARAVVIVFALGVLAYLFYQFIQEPQVPETLYIASLLSWGITVYLLLTEILKVGLGRWLSTNFTEPPNMWVRWLEYPYLLLGILGLLVTVNRLPVMQGAIPKLDLVGPIILMTAAAIKFLKTRAEINDWHIPDTLESAHW
jgi:hypothetical protein